MNLWESKIIPDAHLIGNNLFHILMLSVEKIVRQMLVKEIIRRRRY